MIPVSGIITFDRTKYCFVIVFYFFQIFEYGPTETTPFFQQYQPYKAGIFFACQNQLFLFPFPGTAICSLTGSLFLFLKDFSNQY